MDSRRPGILEVLVALASTAVGAWLMMSPQEQYWIKLRALRTAQRAAGHLARREGHAGMGDELAGRDFWRYSLAYQMSRVRDALGQVLEDMRP